MVALDASAAEITAAISRVLDDPAHRESMRGAGHEFAKEWTFRRVADEVADVVRATLRS
jgi:glycosyltransferase involved in cell wall biosynthesis